MVAVSLSCHTQRECAIAQCPLALTRFITYGDPGNARCLATGDFDIDGHLDLVVANYTAGSVVVLRGRGDGTFTIVYNQQTSAVQTLVAVADLNNDSKPDFVVTNSNEFVSVFLGNGDCTFQGPSQVSAGATVNQTLYCGTGDFDNDQKLDILVSSNTFNGWAGALLRGNGNGTFQSPVVVPVYNAFCIGMIDSDQDLDVLLAYDATTLLGDGQGAFGQAASHAVGVQHGYSVSIADFNSDGAADLAVPRAVTPNGWGAVAVNLGSANGTFGPAMLYTSGPSSSLFSGSYSVAVEDMDSDGDLDLVVGIQGWASVLRGDGLGSFQAPLSVPIPLLQGVNFGTISVSVGDFNEDGRPDFACVNGQISIVLNGESIPITQQPAPASIHAGQQLMLTVATSVGGEISYRWRRNGMPLMNDGRITGADTSTLVIDPAFVTDIGDYDVLLDGPCRIVTTSESATVQVNCVTGQSPTFALHPTDQSVLLGGVATFSVSASGLPPFSYQWRRSGIPLADTGNVAGSNTDTLTISSAGISDGGVAYDCIVTNTCGSDRSNPAGLRVTTTTNCLGDFDNSGQLDGLDIPGFTSALLSHNACP